MEKDKVNLTNLWDNINMSNINKIAITERVGTKTFEEIIAKSVWKWVKAKTNILEKLNELQTWYI